MNIREQIVELIKQSHIDEHHLVSEAMDFGRMGASSKDIDESRLKYADSILAIIQPEIEKAKREAVDHKDCIPCEDRLRQAGRMEVVDWLITRGIFLPSHMEHGSPMEDKLTEWGLK